MHSHKEMQLPNFHLSAVHQSIHWHYILPVCLSPHIEGSLEVPPVEFTVADTVADRLECRKFSSSIYSRSPRILLCARFRLSVFFPFFVFSTACCTEVNTNYKVNILCNL